MEIVKHTLTLLALGIIVLLVMRELVPKIFPAEKSPTTIVITTPPDTIPVPVISYRTKKDSSAFYRSQVDSLRRILCDTIRVVERDSIAEDLFLPYHATIPTLRSRSFVTIFPTLPMKDRIRIDSTWYPDIRVDTILVKPGLPWYIWLGAGLGIGLAL